MAITAAAVKSYTRAHASDIGDDLFLQILNIVNRRLLRIVHVQNQENLAVNLIAGTADYALSDDVLRIWDAHHELSQASRTPLIPTSSDEAYRSMRSYQYQSSGQPGYYWLEGTNLTLLPTPDTSTSGTYPRLMLKVTLAPVLDLGSSLAGGVPDEKAHALAVLAEYGRMKRHDSYKDWRAEADREEMRLRRYAYGRVARSRPSVTVDLKGPARW